MRNALALLPMLVLGGAGAFAVVGTAAAEEPPPLVETITVTVTVPELVEGRGARRWAQIAKSNGRTARAEARTIRKLRAAIRAETPLRSTWLERAFLCIKQFEGGWRTNTGNGYFGALQMDGDFMGTYGAPFYRAWGTADRWPPAVQMTVAMRAYLSGRGFRPWPNTSRMCGL